MEKKSSVLNVDVKVYCEKVFMEYVLIVITDLNYGELAEW